MGDEVIATYFALDKRIAKTKNRIKWREDKFYIERSFTQQTYEWSGELVSVGIDVEREVVNHLTCIQMAEKQLEVLSFKQHHFKRFWLSLDQEQRTYYLLRYVDDLPGTVPKYDRLIAEEVAEIEDAVDIRFKKKEVTVAEQLEEMDASDHLAAMAELLGV